MPSKHIDASIWREIEKRTVEAVVETRVSIKETEILKAAIEIGLQHMESETYHKIAKEKQKK